jgi:hypothetical protein
MFYTALVIANVLFLAIIGVLIHPSVLQVLGVH